MKREDKIKKLNELGIYEQWYNNVVNGENPEDMDDLLDYEYDWYEFILCSFIWDKTKEGIYYWGDIAINK